MNSIFMPFSLAVTMLLFALPLPAQPLQRVRVALSTPTPHMAPLWVAKDKRFFDKHGLDVQLI
ncbi:MAG: ABC transporter substrate-binding protein, partial [Candidatus Binatia bacterium]